MCRNSNKERGSRPRRACGSFSRWSRGNSCFGYQRFIQTVALSVQRLKELWSRLVPAESIKRRQLLAATFVYVLSPAILCMCVISDIGTTLLMVGGPPLSSLFFFSRSPPYKTNKKLALVLSVASLCSTPLLSFYCLSKTTWMYEQAVIHWSKGLIMFGVVVGIAIAISLWTAGILALFLILIVVGIYWNFLPAIPLIVFCCSMLDKEIWNKFTNRDYKGLFEKLIRRIIIYFFILTLTALSCGQFDPIFHSTLVTDHMTHMPPSTVCEKITSFTVSSFFYNLLSLVGLGVAERENCPFCREQIKHCC